MNKLKNTQDSVFKKGTVHRPIGLFKKEKVDLRDVIYNSYHSQDTLGGYVRDKDLSGRRQQVYIDKDNKQLLYSVAGTQSGTDIFNDLALASGGLKGTARYKSADQTLKEAKSKYDGYDTTIVGSSLGGAIAQRLGGANDRRITYNNAEVGGKRRDNTTKIRYDGDVVSFGGVGSSRTFGNSFGFINPLDWGYSHSSDRLKGQGYFV